MRAFSIPAFWGTLLPLFRLLPSAMGIVVISLHHHPGDTPWFSSLIDLKTEDRWFGINTHFGRGYPSVVFWKRFMESKVSETLHVWKLSILPSYLLDSLATYRILGWKLFSFRSLKAFSYCLLASVFLKNVKLFWNMIPGFLFFLFFLSGIF